jgi:Zn ribbon nucleic-acid-binding protein
MNMKKTKPKKLLTVLLTLYLALSIVPITAYAGVTDVTGGTTTNHYSHFYHTKVETTAQVTIKDADGNVIETTEVTKSGDFIEGNVSDDAVQAEIKRIDDEIIAQFSSRGNITTENRNSTFMFDHFESSNIITPGDNILVGDQDALENAASGSVNKNLVVHEYQVYQTTYDLIVQAIDGGSQDEATINNVCIENVKFDYRSGDAPQATAEVYNADADKYEIAYECWQEFENNEPVAAWYSDNGSHGSLPTITEFESGKRYVYSLMLKPKDGYSFNSETTVTVNGESVKSSLSGEYLYVPAVKTITPTKQNSTLTAIDVENVKLDYQPGDAPQASAKKAGTNQDKYDILFECWEKLEKDANDTLNSDGYWYSDESCYSDGDVRFSTFEKGGRYEYSVKLQAKDGYTFDSNLTNKENVTLNGASLPSFAWVMVMDDGKTCLIQYGTFLRPGQAVEKIDFNARINFDAGDKPSFMTSAVNPFIDLDHERWDGSGYGITSSDYWNERYNGKLITEFEAGKSYTYGVYFKISDLGMEEGYRFDKNTKLYINGEEITLTPDQISIDDSGETIWFMNVLTMTPTTVKVIDVVEINNVTVSFKDGDKPVFTGKSPEGVKYAYNCEWWELDSKTGAISADFFSGAYENKITAFEAGKTYHYGVYVKAVGYVESENTTYVFGPNTKLKINGEFVNYKRYEGDTSDGSDSTMWVLTDLTMTPASDGHTHNYGTEWKYDETNHWHECECGNKADITAHTFKQIIDKEATATEKGSKHEECTVCGYKKAAVDIPKIDSHNHNYGTEWKYDETNHWHECEDGEKADITAHTFKQIIDKEATTAEKGSKHEECTVCGYKKTAVDIPVTDFGNSSDDQPNKPINTASSESSSADQTNKPINTASPKTGNTDYMILWIVLLIAGGGVFITATAVDRKKK